MSPSDAPSISPTLAPTFSPSLAPTRYPTSGDEYDSYIEVIYLVKSKSASIIQHIVTDIKVVMAEMIAIIEQGYIDHEAWQLYYFEFGVQVFDINGKSIEELSKENDLFSLFTYWSGNEGLKLNSTIQCEKSVCNRISVKYVQNKFEDMVSMLLRNYFRSNIHNKISTDAQNPDQSLLDIEFEVLFMSDNIKELYPEIIEPPQYVFYGLVSVTSVIVVIGLLGLVYNKKADKLSKLPGCNIVDDGKWAAIIIFALQFWYESVPLLL